MEVYKDLWKTSKERDNMIEYGIGSENLRKLISKDDSGASSGSEDISLRCVDVCSAWDKTKDKTWKDLGRSWLVRSLQHD